ncbi:hypothetical protein GE09DRAFT_1154428 [Coniochaeta sp. 2T2.1]|nr:hypothetical protein GE09DRAFT_1154428 [Coniochaeta sp. 2T2.1]
MMANIANCPSDSIPAIESLPVPHDINLMIIASTNASSPQKDQMVTCCKPNQVQVVNDCWLWCEIPKAYYDKYHGDKDAVRDGTSACVRGSSNTTSAPAIQGWQFNTGTRTGICSGKEMAVVVLALSGLIYAM